MPVSAACSEKSMVVIDGRRRLEDIIEEAAQDDKGVGNSFQIITCASCCQQIEIKAGESALTADSPAFLTFHVFILDSQRKYCERIKNLARMIIGTFRKLGREA